MNRITSLGHDPSISTSSDKFLIPMNSHPSLGHNQIHSISDDVSHDITITKNSFIEKMQLESHVKPHLQQRLKSQFIQFCITTTLLQLLSIV